MEVAPAPLTHHDVHAEVFHRHVEHFLSWAAHAVRISSRNSTSPGVSEDRDRRQIPGMLNRGAGGDAQGRVHLRGNNHGQGGLTQAGRTRKQRRRSALRPRIFEASSTRESSLAHATLTRRSRPGTWGAGPPQSSSLRVLLPSRPGAARARPGRRAPGRGNTRRKPGMPRPADRRDSGS